MKKISVLFVCLGNICRSPVAAGVFRHLVKERALEDRFIIDSCGTGGWHVGQSAHPESTRVAEAHGISIADHRARQLKQDDFSRFDILLAMDRSNLRDMTRLQGKSTAKVKCLRDYDPEDTDLDVPDPFYGGEDGFLEVQRIIHRCCVCLLEELAEQVS